MQLLVQCFLGVLTLAALMIAALSAQHRRALLALQATRDELESRVSARTAQLRESEQWLLKAQQAARAGVWQVDLNSGIFKASDEALRPHGLPPGTAMTHEKALAAVHPDDRPRSRRLCGAPGRRMCRFVSNCARRNPTARCAGCSRRRRRAAVRAGGGFRLVQDITARKQAEEQLRLMMGEINHRSKNLLTLVQVVARQTGGADLKDFRQRFEERIHALAAHQDLLLQQDWHGIVLEDLVRTQLAHFQDMIDKRIMIKGPSLMVTAAASQTLGMALHELATNASKYGALSAASGRVDITWSLSAGDAAAQRFVMSWVSMTARRWSSRRSADSAAR